MLADNQKSGLRDFYARVQSGLPGFRARAGQRQMVAQIAHTIAAARQDPESDADNDGRNIAVIEGRTGVGKTVGYLVPGLYMSRELEKTLVISTGSVALQEQLINRDLPLIAELAPFPVTYALAKGRRRYVCTRRLYELSGHGSGGLFDGEVAAWDRRPEQSEVALLADLAERFDRREWDGDLDSLQMRPPDDLWRRISTDKPGCTGKRCPMQSACPYAEARKSLSKVDVVVANHDLVLSCLASQSRLLPAPKDAVYVFDEAHHLPAVALSRFSGSMRLTSSAAWIEKAPASLSKVVRLLNESDHPCMALGDEMRVLGEGLTQLHSGLSGGTLFADKPTYRFKLGEIGPALTDLLVGVRNRALACLRLLDQLREGLDERAEAGQIKAETLEAAFMDVAMDTSRIENIANVCELLLASSEKDAQPLAKWVERIDEGRDHQLSASPISAGGLLDEYLFSKVSAAVLTSATLSSLGSFSYFLKNVGLDRYPAAAALAVASPFDYPRQGQLHIPALVSDPKDAQGHTDELCRVVPELLSGTENGALALFASRRQLQAVVDALPPEIRAMALVQGELSRAELLAEHAKRIDEGKPSVIFGLASFGEGLDLPGRLCEHVLIAKIPFAPPDAPLDEAQSEWIERSGGKPFFEISLPRAALTLVQWVGRAIRTESDCARITILDTRIDTKRYGRDLLRSLPDFSRVRMPLAQSKLREKLNSC